MLVVRFLHGTPERLRALPERAVRNRLEERLEEAHRPRLLGGKRVQVVAPRQTDSAYAGVIPIFLEQARNDEPLTVDGDGSQTRDFVHIDDVVQANLLAATTDAVGEGYNIGTGTETSVLDLAETIQQATTTESKIVHTEPRTADIDHSVADISKARERLGYEPRMSLREGIDALQKTTRSTELD
nr:GDP-mannose 4,6-dehydratase [Haloglomus salinum]